MSTDLSDVNAPLYLAGAVAAWAGAYGIFLCSTTLAAAFADHPFVTEFYPVERFANFLRQAIIGGLSLFTGLTGLTGLGLFLLGANVAIANLRGTTPSSFPLDEEYNDSLKKTTSLKDDDASTPE